MFACLANSPLQVCLGNYIPCFLAFHIMAVIDWMAGMLYLPRLFAYHAAATPDSESSETFKVMERRLLKGIMNPAIIAVFVLGFTLAWLTGAYEDTWLQIKFALVLGMAGLHGFLSRCRRDFANDRNTRSPRFYKILNEVPAVLIVIIVL